MKVSKHVWVDPSMKWSKVQQIKLERLNCYGHAGYIICTSSQSQWLFEVIRTRQLKAGHKQCYMLGLVPTRQMAIEYIAYLIDAIYNKKSLTLETLTT